MGTEEPSDCSRRKYVTTILITDPFPWQDLFKEPFQELNNFIHIWIAEIFF